MQQRLGDILVEQGAISRQALESALPNTRARGRIGEFLHAYNFISTRQLARAVARQHDLAYIELNKNPPQKALVRPHELPHYLRYRYLPIAIEQGVLQVACTNPSPILQQSIAQRTGMKVQLHVTSPRDLTAALGNYANCAVTRQAQHGLRRRYRHLSAAHGMLPAQRRALWLLAILIAGAFLYDTQASWYALLVGCNLFYFVALAFKLQLYVQGTRCARRQIRYEHQLAIAAAAIAPEDLPNYSILVPLYRESPAVMARLIAQLDGLDYPKDRLDIKLIIEADDTETRDGLLALKPPQTMEIIAVPPSSPRTKPKACNVALAQVRGEYLVIFDAEDAPAPDQLRRAVAMFHAHGPHLACVQAALNYYNREENLLTRLFALEYSTLFRLLLPALEFMGLPIPLGGTSNHLRVATLHEVGGWDAFNVTEDADLGIRLRYFGYGTRVLPSLTLEEAPITLGAWMRQRTRWIKGYILTWLVYMREPGELKRRLGTRAYYGFQFFVGAPALTFLLSPLLWGVFLLAGLGLAPNALSSTMLGLCMVSLIGGVGSHILYARAVLRLERWGGMRLALWVFPFYWLLHSIACARALWQLFRAPHRWEKTTHGVSRMFRQSARPDLGKNSAV